MSNKNYVIVNGLTVVHKGSQGVAVASAPDVCWTPTPDGMKPLPYPNSARSSDLVDGTTTVTVDGNSIAVEGCAFGTSTGDEAGTGGGVVSGVNKGKAKFSNYSFDVMIEGRCACRLGDPMTMNGNGPQTMTLAETQEPAEKFVREKEQKGTVKVKVVNKYTGTPIESATIIVAHRKATTDANGEATIDKLRASRHWLTARKAWPSEDYFVFVSHYPKATISHDAKSEATALVEVNPGATAEVQLELEEYRSLEKVILHRNHIHPKGEDKFGHWWTVIDDESSYGWWPKYPVGSEEAAVANSGQPPEPPKPLGDDATLTERIQHTFDSLAYFRQSAKYDVQNSLPGQVVIGMDGDLNGVQSFGGWLKRLGDPADRDPHHMNGDPGEENYQPVLHDGRKDAGIKEAMRIFALAYSGKWNWCLEFGNNCHTFQKRMIKHCDLQEFKNK